MKLFDFEKKRTNLYDILGDGGGGGGTILVPTSTLLQIAAAYYDNKVAILSADDNNLRLELLYKDLTLCAASTLKTENAKKSQPQMIFKSPSNDTLGTAIIALN